MGRASEDDEIFPDERSKAGSPDPYAWPMTFAASVRKTLLLGAAATAVAFVAPACGSTGTDPDDRASATTAEISQSTTSGVRVYVGNGVRFEFPAEWNRGEVDEPPEARFSVGVGYPGSANFVSVRAFNVPKRARPARLINRHLPEIEEFERGLLAEDGARMLGHVGPVTVAGLPGFEYRARYPENQMTRKVTFFTSDVQYILECSWDVMNPLDAERGCAQILGTLTLDG